MIGQLIMVGFRGMDVNNDHFIVRDIEEYNLCGVVLFDYDVILKEFSRNIKSPSQVLNLTQKLQEYSRIPLFIAVDMEGGRVNRLKCECGFDKTYSAKQLGDKNDIEFTKNAGENIAKTLFDIGINLNFAPVVDVNINPKSPAIGKLERSFSGNPHIVINQALAFIEGHEKYNIITCLKHFPGHGSAEDDTHLGITDITKTWQKIELMPYREIIKADKCSMIMTGHLFNKKLDRNYPSTLSKNMINNILRNKLKYQGVVISDDLQMKAITNHFGLKQSIHLAINSGIDILLFGNNLEYDEDVTPRAVSIIIELLDEGKISLSRLEESYNRIMSLKKKYIAVKETENE